jgi:DNA-binding helix-hairpin-helix protein with protein kinase domain
VTPNPLLDARGNPVSLGAELGRGGEGAVFDVAGRPDTVAKIYIKAPPPYPASKLAAMASMANDHLLKIAAWPTGTLHDASGNMVGFTMPKVGGHEPVFKLYGPKLRMREFPKADWRFLIHAAANAARSFSTVHAASLVIGDVNHGNLVVGQDAMVRMIDCDSFQVSAGGQTWFCDVGVGTHQPPEMQNRTSYAVLRTPNHDNFGLAVIIFQLLCIARHPFSGRFKGSGEPPSIEEAIAASRYAYSHNRSRTAMEPPPGSLPIDALTPHLQNLFEKAFAPESVRGGRPTAAQWVSALGDLSAELKPCSANGGHFFRRGLGTCPWCTIEATTGTVLFPVVFTPGKTGTSGMAALWQEVARVPEPPPIGPCPAPPSPSTTLSPEAREVLEKGRSLRTGAWVSVGFAVLLSMGAASPGARALLIPLIGIFTFLIQYHAKASAPGPFKKRLAMVKADWEAMSRAWSQAPQGPSSTGIRGSLTTLKAQFDGLPAERARRLQQLQDQRREKQLEEHLDRFPIAYAKISGIGPAKVAALASHGIDTAGDVIEHRVLAVPGFGKATFAKLLVWRRRHEASFRFDPNRGVAAADQAGVERDIVTKRAKLEAEVSAGLARLRAVSAAQSSRHQYLMGQAAELAPRYAQALADAAAEPANKRTHQQMLLMSGVATGIAIFSGLGSPAAPTSRGPSTYSAPSARVMPVSPPVAPSGLPAASHPEHRQAPALLPSLRENAPGVQEQTRIVPVPAPAPEAAASATTSPRDAPTVDLDALVSQPAPSVQMRPLVPPAVTPMPAWQPPPGSRQAVTMSNVVLRSRPGYRGALGQPLPRGSRIALLSQIFADGQHWGEISSPAGNGYIPLDALGIVE